LAIFLDKFSFSQVCVGWSMHTHTHMYLYKHYNCNAYCTLLRFVNERAIHSLIYIIRFTSRND